jgi:hypothetical protein
MCFLGDLKEFCERLNDETILVDMTESGVLFYSKRQGVPLCKLQVTEGYYQFGGFERGEFYRTFSTTDRALAFKVLVLVKCPLVRSALRYPKIVFPARRKEWPFSPLYGRKGSLIDCDIDGYADKLSWVHDLSSEQLLDAYVSKNGGLLSAWTS